MKLALDYPTPGLRLRPGFTLVELLVVVAIIAVLVGLTAGAALQVMNTQRQSNSEQTVQKVYTLLKQKWDIVASQAKKEPIPGTLLGLAGGDEERARVIWVKLRLRQEFPMNYTEAVSPITLAPTVTLLPLPAYVRAIGTLPRGNPAPPAESGACLLLALTRSHSGVGVNEDALGAHAVGDSNRDGLNEVIDSWGRPLVLYRFPTGNAELNSRNPAVAGTQAQFRDPLDPKGLLMSPAWWGSPGRAAFEQLLHSVSNAAGNGPASTYHVPVVVSAGRNGQLGLSPWQVAPLVLPNPMQIVNLEQANDNIDSYNVR